MLPQTNARLISITTDGTSEDWDEPAGPAGPAKWSGNEDAYVTEKIRTNFPTGAGALGKRKDMQIRVSGNLRDTTGAPVTINTGDIITFEWRGVTHARRVMDWEAPMMPSLPLQNYVKLHLNPEAVETALESE